MGAYGGTNATLNGKTGIFVPASWGSVWRPKLTAAKTGAGLARLAVVGDSKGRGYYASKLSKGWVGLLAALMQGANGSVGDGGSGFQSVADSVGYMTTAGLTTGQANYYASGGGGYDGSFGAVTGSWNSKATASPVINDGPSSTYIYSTTASSTVSWPAVRGTQVTVFFIQAGGTATVNIDGTNYVANISSTAGITAFSQTVAAGSHSVTVTVTTPGANGIYVCGVEGRNASGVLINNFSRAAMFTSEVANIVGASSTQGGPTAAASSGSYGPAGLWSGGPSWPADLVIFDMGTNDLHSSVAPATILYNIEGYLDGLKGAVSASAVTPCDVVLVAPTAGQYDANRGLGQVAQGLRAMAEHYGAAFIDPSAAIFSNSYAAAQALHYWSGGPSQPGDATGTPDGTHEGDTGHNLKAALLAQLVTAIV